jgi:hypothetical protein
MDIGDSPMTDETLDHAREVVRRVYEEHGSPFYTLTDYGRGETDYVRVFYATEDRQIHEITYHVAQVIGVEKIKPGRGIPRAGGQYNKGLDTVDAACRAVGLELDQLNGWWEL